MKYNLTSMYAWLNIMISIDIDIFATSMRPIRV